MSSKKSNNSGATIDDSFVQEKASGAGGSATANKRVNLKEFNKTAPFSFNAKNYRLLLIGLAINILGYILMIGGAAEDPSEFNADELFSFTRITLAPILIVAGFVVIMFSIMKKPKSE